MNNQFRTWLFQLRCKHVSLFCLLFPEPNTPSTVHMCEQGQLVFLFVCLHLFYIN